MSDQFMETEEEITDSLEVQVGMHPVITNDAWVLNLLYFQQVEKEDSQYAI